MADRDQRWPDNTPGRFYVDEKCIAAKLCVGVAPDLFRMSDRGHAYVHRQPQTPEELERCLEAVRGCPVNAIGDDGE